MFMLEHTANTKRQTKVVGQGESTAMVTKLTGATCLCLPMADRAAISLGYNVGQAYEVYFELGTDIKKGDQITVNGLTLVVSGIQVFNASHLAHLKVIAESKNT